MTKVISLSDAAYEEMKAMKESDESFSDLVFRLLDKSRQRKLMEFLGSWPGTFEEAEKIKRSLSKERTNFKTKNISL